MADSTVQDDLTPSPTIAEDWENDEGAEDLMHKQLEEKLKQVRILQREKADQNSMIERAKQEEEQSSSMPGTSVPLVAFQPPLKMQILQRPKGYEDPNAKKTDANAKIKPTMEERQAAYDEARNRILGSNYKPEIAANPVIASVSSNSRNKSPEQIRVRRPSPEFLMSMHPPHGMQSNASAPSLYGNYVPSMQVAHHAQTYHHMAPQGFVPYIDTSRPPPQTPPQVPMSNACGVLSQGGAFAPIPSIAHYPPTGQYYTVMPTPVPQPVPFGAPPVALYPPGTLGSIMQFNTIAPGQTSSQRKKNKKKPGSVPQAAQQTA